MKIKNENRKYEEWKSDFLLTQQKLMERLRMYVVRIRMSSLKYQVCPFYFFVKFNRKRRIKLELGGDADIEKLLNDFIYNTINNSNYYHLYYRLFEDGYDKLTIVS